MELEFFHRHLEASQCVVTVPSW